ncbi:hypothetical protein BGX21_005233, partial [Mortierella sp. AD011]
GLRVRGEGATEGTNSGIYRERGAEFNLSGEMHAHGGILPRRSSSLDIPFPHLQFLLSFQHSLDFYGPLWTSVDFQKLLWTFKNFCGLLWTLMDTLNI